MNATRRRRRLAAAASVGVRYALWLLVPIRLILPPTLPFDTGGSWWELPPLTDRSILNIPQVDALASPESAVEEVFPLLPPQRFRHWFADQSGQIEAMTLTYAMAREHSPHLFLQTARRLNCLKAGKAHHDKFPVAAFENIEHASPEWRPNTLAASVTGLQGLQIEDSRQIEQIRSEFG